MVFCLVGTGLSLVTAINNFHPKVSADFTVTSIAPVAPAKLRQPKARFLSLKVQQRLYGFQKYLDSLQNTASGKKIYDSLLLKRPHLLDSLRVIDSLYFKH